MRTTERQAYGKLIRIMAHEINNAMGAVTSTFDLLADAPELRADGELTSLVESCSHRCRSLCDFIGKYADVARLPLPKTMSVEVGELLDRLAPVLSVTARDACPGATLRVDRGEGFTARLDAPQMEQVLVNIVKNAAGKHRPHSAGQGGDCD